MTEELEKCPFCGGDASVEEFPSNFRPLCNKYSCGCDNKDCIGYQSLTMFDRKTDAIKAWNTRARRAENGTGAQETVAARVPEIDGLDETLSLIKTMKRILGEHKGSALWSTCFEGKLVWFSMKELMILESASRAYTELPKMQKVELDEMKDTYKYATEELHRQAVGYNNAIDDIESKYGDLYEEVK